jgi:hypothetical protein
MSMLTTSVPLVWLNEVSWTAELTDLRRETAGD